MKKYKLAPWDTTIKFFTITTALIYISIVLTYIVLTSIALWMTDNLANVIIVITFLMLTSAYFFSPRYYLIDKKEVKISRLVGPILIPLEEVCGIEKVENVTFTLGLIGSGGLFSHYGTYLQNSTKAKVYATRYSQMVRISTSKITYYISPDNPKSFMKDIKARWSELHKL